MAKGEKKEMKKANQILAALVVVLSLLLGYVVGQQRGWFVREAGDGGVGGLEREYVGGSVELPTPSLRGGLSVEAAMKARRSRRSFREEPLTIKQVSQLVWSLQGETAEWGGRTTPSAKSAYPLELTVVVKNVEEMDPGVYHYSPNTHSLSKTIEGVPEKFDEAAVQKAGQTSPLVIFISADFSKMTEAFDGEKNDDNVLLEAGHAGQNLYLQVESLGLGTVVMGGFNHGLMQETLKIPSSEVLIYQIPVGIPSES